MFLLLLNKGHISFSELLFFCMYKTQYEWTDFKKLGNVNFGKILGNCNTKKNKNSDFLKTRFNDYTQFFFLCY